MLKKFLKTKGVPLMFNNTSRVKLYTYEQSTWVILPMSERVLSSEEIDKKIEKMKSHISHLSALSHNKTHGGKRFRAVQISLHNQMSSAKDRLNLLLIAKAAFPLKTVAAVASATNPVGPSGWFAGTKIKIIDTYEQY